MRIGLASDTHGNVALLERALEHFGRAEVERIFFLGARVADLDLALSRRAERARGSAAGDPLAGRVVRVASLACPEHASGAVPTKQVDMLDGRICCLVHDKAALTRDDIENASLLFHGNAGAAAVVQIGPRCFVTPGHLGAPPPEARPRTFAIAEVTARELVLTVFSEECAELRQERASFAAAGKLSVR